MPYGLQPDAYVPLFRSVATAVRAASNDVSCSLVSICRSRSNFCRAQTYMLYAPNVWNGPVDDPQQGYQVYFPGEECTLLVFFCVDPISFTDFPRSDVDIVGLSFYSLGEDKAFNQAPDSDLFRSGFTPFYELFSPKSASSSSNNLKLTAAYPVVITETSAPYYYHIPPGSKYFLQQGDTDISTPLPNLTTYSPSQASPPNPHTDDELYLKASWMVQLTSNTTAARYPNLRAVSWFNYLKKGSSQQQVLADFRFVGGNATVEQWVRQNFGNQTAYENGYTGGGARLGGGGVLASLVGMIGILTLVV